MKADRISGNDEAEPRTRILSQGNEPGHPAGDGANKKGDGRFQMSIHFVDFRCPSISWVWRISHTVCYTSAGVKFDALTITSH